MKYFLHFTLTIFIRLPSERYVLLYGVNALLPAREHQVFVYGLRNETQLTRFSAGFEPFTNKLKGLIAIPQFSALSEMR